MTSSSLTSVGTLGSLTVTAPISGSVTGNAATATALATPRTINGVSFDGTSNINITATADAGTLTGTTLAGTVTASSLTSVGTLGSLTVTAPISGSITGNAATATLASTVTTNANLTGEVTSTGNATTVTNAAVIGKVLTGYTAGAGTVAATDNILQAIQKIDGNAAAATAAASGKQDVLTNSAGLAGALDDETGTGLAVFATSPTLTTPTIGVATATSVNKVAITAPATGSTLTIADGKTLTASNSLTLTGTDGSTLNVGTGGTLGTNAYTSTAFAPLASPTFTGIPAAPTAAALTSTTQVATTAFVTAADNLKANLASPTFTGTPTLPTGTIAVTQAANNNSTAVATTAYVDAAKFQNGTATGNTPYWNGTSWVTNSSNIYNAGASVGIGLTPSGTYKLEVNGRLKSTGINESSDIRWKKDISTVQNALAKVLEMRGVNYNWKTQEFPEKNFESDLQLGLIAQEVEKVIPEVVDTDDNGFKSVEYSKLVALLLEAIKDQQKQISKQEADIAALKFDIKRIDKMEEELAQFKILLQNIVKSNVSAQSNQ